MRTKQFPNIGEDIEVWNDHRVNSQILPFVGYIQEGKGTVLVNDNGTIRYYSNFIRLDYKKDGNPFYYRVFSTSENDYIRGYDNEISTFIVGDGTEIYNTDIVEMSTGLKSKSGKLIFQNDIIQAGDAIMKIGYNKHNASFCLNSKGWAFCHYFGEAVNAKDCEIVGNVWANKVI